MKKKPIAKAALLLILVFVLLEGILRLQQQLGPIIDLRFENIKLDGLSDLVNHKNIGISSAFLHGKEITKLHDSYGIRTDRSMSGQINYNQAFKILCMGDSAMEGLEDEYTIPHNIQGYLDGVKFKGAPIGLLNAGCSSYSPAIFIPQAKMLIPKLKPDFLLLSIHETDLGDDFVRYKNLIVRDGAGKIIAVRRTPINHLFISGFVNIRKHPLYLTRLFSKIIHTRIYMPLVIKKYRAQDNRDVLSFSSDKDGSYAKYAQEISFFENNLEQLLGTLEDLMQDKNRILVIYAPHLYHLKPDKHGFIWNHFVSNAVDKVCRKKGLAFYNATEDLKASFGNNPEKYYAYDSMHLSRSGAKVYSKFVSEQVLLMINRLGNN